MTTRKIFRNAALTFPEVAEEQRNDKVRYTVRGTPFAALTADGTVQLHLPAEIADEAIAKYEGATRLMHAGRPIGFAAPLDEVGGQHLWALTLAAWKHRAPKRLAGELQSILDSRAQPASDLPAGIGKAATRALLTAGLSTLDDIAKCTTAQLLAMHGVGPKAVRILGDTLAEQGKSLSD